MSPMTIAPVLKYSISNLFGGRSDGVVSGEDCGGSGDHVNDTSGFGSGAFVAFGSGGFTTFAEGAFTTLGSGLLPRNNVK